MNQTSEHRLGRSFLLYTAVAAVAFFPCLFMGKAYFANDLLNQYAHFRALLKLQLAQGHFPLWNPYFFGGQPFFADPNVMMCYPLTYLTLIFPIPYGLGVFFFIHMVLAAMGMHLWLRTLRISDGACRVGALLFALSGCFWWELIHPPILAAYAWFPWVMAFVELLTKEWKFRWGFLSGLCFALVFCCGNFQSTTTVLYTALSYFLFRAFFREDAGTPPKAPLPWKKIVMALLFVLWGLAPLAAHLFPAYEFSKYSNRRDPNQTYEQFNGQFSMRPLDTYEFLYPSLAVPAGSTIEMAIQQVTDQVNIGNNFLGAFGYLGIWMPFLVFLAFQRKDKRFLYFLAGLALLSILTAWGRYTPLHRLECLLLPGIKLSRAPFRFVQAFLLVASLLCAWGYQNLERSWAEEKPKSSWLWPAGLFALVLFLPALANPAQTWREMLALAVGFLGLWLGLGTVTWKPLGRTLWQGALILPLLLSGWGTFSLGPASNYDLETHFPAFSTLRQGPTPCRYFFNSDLQYPVEMGSQELAWIFPQDAPMVLGIRDCAGYNPINLTTYTEVRHSSLDAFLKMLAVRGIVTGQEAKIPGEWDQQVVGQAHLYIAKQPPAYVTAPPDIQVVPDAIDRLQRMKAPDFDPAKTVYLSQPISPMPDKTDAGLTYQLDKEEPNHQWFKVHVGRDALVVFSEILFPGWKAKVDGAPAPLLTANHAFRALTLMKGDHQVEFLYEPFWAEPLLWGGVIWLVSVVLLGGAFLLRKRKPTVAPAQP